MAKKKVHFGGEESGYTDWFDAWALCHDIYERDDSKVTKYKEHVTCKRCLKMLAQGKE